MQSSFHKVYSILQMKLNVLEDEEGIAIIIANEQDSKATGEGRFLRTLKLIVYYR